MDNQFFPLIASSIGLLIAITIHEFAHAFVADKLGDPTPRSYGRVSLNPLAHLDPIGTIMLFVAHFGWGKPVPIDPYNLTKKEENLVAIAGIAANMLLATVLMIIVRLAKIGGIVDGTLIFIIMVNVNLAVFNLIPIPPLDGSKLLLNLLPDELSVRWAQAFDRYGFIILILFLFFPIGHSNLADIFMTPIIKFIYQLFTL